MTILKHYLVTFSAHPRMTYYLCPVLIEKGKKNKLVLEQAQVLQGKAGVEILEEILETQTLHFSSPRAPILKKGSKRQGKLEWITEPGGRKRLQCRISGGGANTILPLEPLWYIDHTTSECGELETSLHPEIVELLLAAPPMKEEEIHEIYVLLKNCSSEEDQRLKLTQHLKKSIAPITEKDIAAWYCDWKEAGGQEHHWLDFEMGIEIDGEKINLLPILAEFVQNQLSFHSVENIDQLPDDKIFQIALPHHKQFSIPASRLKKILSILTELYTEEGLAGNSKLRLSRVQALQFSGLEDALGKPLKWQGNTSPQKIIKQYEKFRNTTLKKLPEDFCGELRAYQTHGVHFLQFLKNADLSGILADDMGLGKTVQVLVHLLMEKHKKKTKKPSLIVTPTSLIMNWEREAKRFTPSLKVLVLHGQCRKEHFDKIKKHDVVLTTYPLLARDEETLAKQAYHVLVLDEAQYIKNFHSKAGQVVRKFSAEQRLCLTGTPLENHLGELWALFHFLLPGLLGSRRQFHTLFRQPIEIHRSVERLEHLKQRISPFFLRRTKQEVLKELPEKIEMFRPILLTESQRELYEDIRISLHYKVLSAIEQQGFSRSQIYILDALLKLRQVCCDPRLLKNQDRALEVEDSAKLQWLLELLPNLVMQGRKILLFSQFTEMLALIESAIQSLDLPYLVLTGKTINRDAVIQQFQSGEFPLFLISLKAGGVGLNLTQADTVIHYDPWWNPAVENQATDRAHRWGQDKTVFVYKLITAGTIEEKIMALQQEKKSLLDAILSGNQNSFEKFNPEDIEKLFAPVG